MENFTLDLTVNDYTIFDSYLYNGISPIIRYPTITVLLLHLMIGLFDRCTDKFKVFSHFLAMAEVDFLCIHA